MVRRSTLAAMIPLALGACFPTIHNARIDPGARIGLSVTRLNDQPRGRGPQRTDYLTMLDVGYGIGHRLEIGAPFGVYWEDGLGNPGEPLDEGLYPIVMPYIKIGLLPDTSNHHLAVFGQAVFAAPAIVGIRYGLERRGWEPHIGLTWMLSEWPRGDSPLVTRYQQEDQFLYLLSAGATWFGPGRPTVEAGVLSNRYRDPSRSSRVRNSLEFTTLYDFYVSIRVIVGG